MKKNVGTGVALILVSLCAVVWNINVFIDLSYGFTNWLHIICTIIWDFCVVIWITRYIKSKKNNKDSSQTTNE